MDGYVCEENPQMADNPNKVDFLKESLVVRGKTNGYEFRMLQSNRGKQSLVRCGFMYRLDHVGKDRVSWRCNNRNCSAQLKTDSTLQTIVQDNEKPHTHAADADKLERQLLRAACKKRAITEKNTGLQEIIQEEARNLGLIFMSTKETKFLQLAMYRERKKAFPESVSHKESNSQTKSKVKALNPVDPIPVIVKMSSTSPNSAMTSPHLNESQRFPELFQPPFDTHFDLLADMAGDPSGFEAKHPPYSLPHAIHLSDLHPQHNITHLQVAPGFGTLPTDSELQTPQHGMEDMESSNNNSPMSTPDSKHAQLSMTVCHNVQELPSDNHYDSSQHTRFIEEFQEHEAMLQDNGVILAYRRSLQENRSLLKGSAVIDVDAKTGILSHLVMQAGAAAVFAVENTSVAECADRTVAENSAGSVIKVLQKNIQDVELQGKVHAIVSNWMGPCLLCKSQLPNVINARDRFLKQDGELFPCSATLFLAPFTDTNFEDRFKSFDRMKKICGVSMESFLHFSRGCHIVKTEKRHLEMDSILASAVRLCHFDLRTVTLQKAQGVESDFSFSCYGDSMIHGFACWFTVAFPGTVYIDTSPFALKTYWGQTVMYLQSSMTVLQGTEITGSFNMQQDISNRDWSIDICYSVNNGVKHRQQWQCIQ